MDSRQPSESVTYGSRVQSRPAAANTSSDPAQRQRLGRTNLVSCTSLDGGGSIPFSGQSKPTTMSSDSQQRKPKKMNARGNPSINPRGQRQSPQTASPSGAQATTSAAKALPRRQTGKPAAPPSSTTSATASPNSSRPATVPPPRQNHVPLTHEIPGPETSDILVKELQYYYPGAHWFDSYDSLDRKLLSAFSKNPDIKNTRLADLEILVRKKDGTQHKVGLQSAVRDTISYLLDVEAKWNPVTEINNMPDGISRPLWEGKLYLGGIKDSGNVEGVLKHLKIDAVVSIHPTDWLTDECWKGLFRKWDGSTPPQSRPEDSKRMQYHIELHDDSSSDLLSYFGKAFEFMDELLVMQRKNVLVHCKMGQSRSASLVLGYMMDRYYRTHLAISDPNKRPPPEKVTKDSKELQGVMKVFLREFALPKGADATAGKRKGVDTKKFDSQLELYAHYLAGGKKGLPPKPSKPAETKTGGGIIKVAVMVLCFMCNLTPTREILGYWPKQKDKYTHYWKAATQDKALKGGIHVDKDMATFNGFFEHYWRLSQLKAPPK